MSDHSKQNIFERFIHLRADPEIIQLREDMSAGKKVFACCAQHRDSVRAVFDEHCPEPTNEEWEAANIALQCRECWLMVAAVQDDLNCLLVE